MHPILARGGRLAFYLASWSAIGLLLGALMMAQVGVGWRPAALVALPLATLYAFVCLSAWYVSRGMPMAATATLRIFATALAASIISSAAWVAAARMWVDWLTVRGLVPRVGRAGAGLYTLLSAFGVLLYLLSLAVSYLIAVFEQSRAAERRALEVQVLAREAELRLLRAQIDPHFLFNSLHSISSLTGSDAAAARRMCLRLADFLRESLALGGEARISLSREVALVARFLAVERVRFGERLRDALIVEEGAGACVVPPLLLLPLVENAVTHGIAHLLAGGTITVRAGRQGSRLEVSIQNPCDPERPRRRGAGLGLGNVRARLLALHGNDARMVAGESEGVWRVELSLPAVVAAPAAVPGAA